MFKEILAIVILIVAAILEVFEIIKDVSKEYKNKFKKRILIAVKGLVALGLGYLAVSSYVEEQNQISINATHGKFGKQKDCLIKNPPIYFGGHNSGYTSVGNTFPIAFEGEGSKPIQVKQENNQLMITAYIRDSKGDMIATISDREWDISNKMGIDYNNDDSAFEIITLDGRVVYQLQLAMNEVFCNGMVCSEYGRCVFFDKDSGVYMGGRPVDAPQRFILPENDVTKPIFKYPRYKNLGIRENNEAKEQSK